jgi:hypothetical protein
VKVSTRAPRLAIEEALLPFTRRNVQIVLAEELGLMWEGDDLIPSRAKSKRTLVDGSIDSWSLSQLVASRDAWTPKPRSRRTTSRNCAATSTRTTEAAALRGQQRTSFSPRRDPCRRHCAETRTTPLP